MMKLQRQQRWTRMPRILNGETAGYVNGNCKGLLEQLLVKAIVAR